MPSVERVDFVSVPTRDLARARRFYGKILGLPSNRDTPDEFETPNVTLALWQPEAEAVASPPTRPESRCASIPSRPRGTNCRRAGPVPGRTVDTGVCLMGFFYDPDGNVLILHRRYAPFRDAAAR